MVESIKKQKRGLAANTALNRSVFHAIYHGTNDFDSKCFLIREAIVIGGEKELQFLKDLVGQKNKHITKLVMSGISRIENRLQINEQHR